MIEINTYIKLKKVIKEFKKGSFDFLIIVGDAGIGKTYNTRKILGKKVCFVNSHTTVLGLYTEAYDKRGLPIWIDDVEGLFDKDKMVGLLKQLCETTPIKIIQYNTSWKMEETRKLPKYFETTSKVIMTANAISRLKNSGMQSLMDRAIVINFRPARSEVLTYIKDNFKSIYDKSIVNYFFNNDEVFSLRDYIKRYQLKKAGLLTESIRINYNFKS